MSRHLSITLLVLVVLGSLQGCAGSNGRAPTPSDVARLSPIPYVTPTFPLTWTPRPPTPTNTRVIPIPPTITPGPSPTATLLPARAKAVVVGVHDSYTIEVWIEGEAMGRGFPVRLLGIEPPLLSDPWSEVALRWMTRELGRQVVLLERD